MAVFIKAHEETDRITAYGAVLNEALSTAAAGVESDIIFLSAIRAVVRQVKLERHAASKKKSCLSSFSDAQRYCQVNRAPPCRAPGLDYFRHASDDIGVKKMRGWFILSIAAWTAFAVLIRAWANVERMIEGRPPAPASDYVMTFVEMYSLGLLTPLLVYVAHVFPPSRRPTILTLAVYVASLIAVCTIGLPLLVLIANTFLNAQFTVKSALGEGIFTFLTYSVVFTIVIVVTQVRIANERLTRALRLEADLTKLRVEALQRQLHPHFIFNTLNAVGAIMQTDVAAAEEMIAALAALLRTATDRSNRPMVPLREELNLLDRYAFIMKLRYGDRLNVAISAEPRSLEILVPSFTLQPLVENAIVHGLDKTVSGITIEVSCRLENDKLRIDVTDDGAAPDMLTFQEGVGIGNTRARLAELYGQRAGLSIAPRESPGTRLTLSIPTAAPAL